MSISSRYSSHFTDKNTEAQKSLIASLKLSSCFVAYKACGLFLCVLPYFLLLSRNVKFCTNLEI